VGSRARVSSEEPGLTISCSEAHFKDRDADTPCGAWHTEAARAACFACKGVLRRLAEASAEKVRKGAQRVRRR
jgi:hypothetical protein